MSPIELVVGGQPTSTLRAWAEPGRRWLVGLGPARVAMAGAGFVPVSLIAASAFGVAELRTMAVRILVPVLAAVALSVAAGRLRLRLVVLATVAGIVSTLLYDGFRFAFMAAGLIDTDPIPHIGEALHLHPDWAVGYVWRYVGNGTGLACAFIALGLRGVRIGAVYGLFVAGGLLFTLAAAPHGEEMLFPLTIATVVMAIGGHLIYGATLGWLTDRR